MRNKNRSRKLVILLLSLVMSGGCSKFEDGPYFSLLTVKQRIARTWKIEFSRNIESGIEHSADFEGWLLSIEKSGNFTRTVIYNQVQSTFTGQWEILGKSQLKFEYPSNTGNITEFYTIMRLTKKELWISNSSEETHLYSD